MYLVGGNVDVAEKVLVHETVVAFGVFFGDANVFVHVEGHDMFERDAAGLVGFDEELVDAFGTASCRQAKDEGAILRGGEVVDAFFWRKTSISCKESPDFQEIRLLTNNVFRYVTRSSVLVVSDDESPRNRDQACPKLLRGRRKPTFWAMNSLSTRSRFG